MVLFRIVGDQLSPLGWSLYHFVWQGMLVASVYSFACLFWGRNARHRYALACFFLGIAMCLPIWQVWMIFNRHHGISLGVGPPERLLPWMTWIALIWLFLAGTISVRGLLASAELRKLWLSHASEDVLLNKKAQEIANQLGLKSPTPVVRSEAADVMAVVGGLRPIIVVPTTLPDCLDDAQFRALLAHEIAHVSRFDPLVNLVLSTLESLVFFHPAAAWLAGELRTAREYCCDDVAVQFSHDALGYARGLTTFAKMSGLGIRGALSANGGDLKARVVRLVLSENALRRFCWDGRRLVLWLCNTVILAAAAKLLCRFM